MIRKLNNDNGLQSILNLTTGVPFWSAKLLEEVLFCDSQYVVISR